MSHSKNLLEHLFGPKAKVLKLFFQQPQLALSVDDICKKTGVKKREGGRLVADFTRLGILKKANNHGKKTEIKKAKK